MTEHVDASYVGGASDGSDGQPWTTIVDAVAAAAPGAIVAIAEGTYNEDVVIAGRAVRLWGVCPDKVNLVGIGEEPAAVFVRSLAHGTELRAMAILGDSGGVVISGSEDVTIDRVWVHDTAFRA